MPDLRLEAELWREGAEHVAGVDEAGRGPLAGPVAAAAVILPPDYENSALDDSKKLTAAEREDVFTQLMQDSSVVWAVAFGDVEEIERVNILQATHAAMARAAMALRQPPAFCLIDGLDVRGFPLAARGVVKGDGISLSIAAASIIAKVSRDRLMCAYAKQFPDYGFERHKGYGTKAHLEALRRYGPCPIHRRTFAPVAEMWLEL